MKKKMKWTEAANGDKDLNSGAFKRPARTQASWRREHYNFRLSRPFFRLSQLGTYTVEMRGGSQRHDG